MAEGQKPPLKDIGQQVPIGESPITKVDVVPQSGGIPGRTTNRNRSLEIGREIIAESKTGGLWEGQVDELEKKVIEGRFTYNLSATALAEQFGITQSQVENMQRAAMLRLRRAVNIQKNNIEKSKNRL